MTKPNHDELRALCEKLLDPDVIAMPYPEVPDMAKGCLALLDEADMFKPSDLPGMETWLRPGMGNSRIRELEATIEHMDAICHMRDKTIKAHREALEPFADKYCAGTKRPVTIEMHDIRRAKEVYDQGGE